MHTSDEKLSIPSVPEVPVEQIHVGAIKKLEVPEEDFTADAPGGEPWNPDEFLPPAEPAPALANRGAAICKAVDLIQLVAPIVILLCLRDGRESFATRAVWDLVPEPKPRYPRLNAVGDVLGRGAGKQSLGLYRDSQGNFICCRENVCLAARRMTPAGLKALALRLGFPTRTDFELAVAALPSAQVGTPM